MGTKDAKVNTITGLNGVAQYVRVEMAGVDMNQAQQIIGKQGKFEIRIQTTGNSTEHVLYGDSITSVEVPSQSPAGSGNWGVGFTLSEDGASTFQNAAINYGATTDPTTTNSPCSSTTRACIRRRCLRDWRDRSRAAPSVNCLLPREPERTECRRQQTLRFNSVAGALPVDVSVTGSGSTSASLGQHYMEMCLIAGILALIMVAFVIFYRYREPRIVLPMVLINASEIVILLGFISVIQFQMDLPTVAGLIAVLGIGIDQLVVITDEILHEGIVPSPNVYLKRLSRALTIIVIAAATVLIAMLPLALMDLSTLKGFAIITMMGVIIGVLVLYRPAYGRIIMDILSE